MCHVMLYEVTREEEDRRSLGDRVIARLGLDPMLYRLRLVQSLYYRVERWPQPMFQNGTAPKGEQ